MVRVRTGITDGTSTEILEGDLNEGDAVVISSSGGAAPSGSAAPRGNSPGGGGMRRMF
jgi:HlyD family secretion protein